MPILKTDFAAALALQDEGAAAHQESNAKRQEARSKRQALAEAIYAWGGLDTSDPFTVRLVEHEGAIYRVSPTDIKLLATESTTDPA